MGLALLEGPILAVASAGCVFWPVTPSLLVPGNYLCVYFAVWAQEARGDPNKLIPCLGCSGHVMSAAGKAA